jgi:DNA-binding MarR family transcriptional regulator/GNAT superfamily N-acetyltransferase
MDIVDVPSESRDQTILELREFSRRLVRELGFMRNTLADSGLAPSAVHAIIEIGATPGIQARDLAAILRLDKSNASRQIGRLETLGLIKRRTSSEDGRSSELTLTAAGQKLRRKIDKFATDQVSDALRRLVPEDQQALVRSLALYADALAHGHEHRATRAAHTESAQMIEGYRPGCIGDIASLHARFYARHAGFGVYFERKVASELAAFAQGLPAPGRALWLVMEGARTLGSLAIDDDGNAPGTKRVAHLRWFIIDDALRGTGMGRELMSRAMAFVDAHYDETYLWTFRSLDAARHLYESFGFELTDEADGDQWGAKVVEQRFVRRRPSR